MLATEHRVASMPARSPSARARSGFTAIELMVVVTVIILLVAMTVPSIFPAIRKGRVHDAANAITRVASQARQLARSRAQPSGQAGDVLKWYGVAVVVPASGSAYAVLTYDSLNPNSSSVSAPFGLQAASSTAANTSYVSKQVFNANVMPFTGVQVAPGPGSKGVYSLQPRNSIVGWYYQYRTGFVINNSSAPTALNCSQIASIGTPAVAANPTTGAPAVIAGTPAVFGVTSLDQIYVVALSIYSIGLANAQDLF